MMKLKVFQNKKNGQLNVNLPKKLLNGIPPKVEVKIPKEFIRLKLKKL